MNPHAHVDSIDVIKAFRAALFKFTESARSGLNDTDADIHRTQVWLEREQKSYWQGQFQKRTRKVAQAKDALRRKKLYKTAAGTTPAANEEEKALQAAERQLAEARMKVEKVRKWRRELEKEVLLYRGQIQVLTQQLDLALPKTITRIDRMLDALDAYTTLAVPEGLVRPAPSGEPATATPSAHRNIYAFRTIDCQALRASTPPLAEREKAEAKTPDAAWARHPAIDADQRQRLATIWPETVLPGPEMKIVVDGAISGASRIYLERIATEDETDSGWYIGGEREVPAAKPESISVEALLKVRPDWQTLLASPPGTLILLNHNEIDAVLDGQNQNVWIASSMRSGTRA